MRHFHGIQKDDIFHSLSINGGEYIIGLELRNTFTQSEGPFCALVKCLGIGYSDALAYLGDKTVGVLTPSEESVLDEFLSFYKLAVTAFDGELQDLGEGIKIRLVEETELVYHYTNLNTGKSVMWYVYLDG